MFTVEVFCDDTAGCEPHRLLHLENLPNLRSGLKLAYAMVHGNPSHYAHIMRNGIIMATLETNWQGKLVEADLAIFRRAGSGLRYSHFFPLNPTGLVFLDWFQTEGTPSGWDYL